MINIDDAARHLARTLFDIEPGMTHIIRLTSSPDVEENESEPIKILEVNEATVAAGIMPLHFGPSPQSGVPYPTVIIAVTPAEFVKIQSQELKLPKDWTLGEELPQPVLDQAG